MARRFKAKTRKTRPARVLCTLGGALYTVLILRCGYFQLVHGPAIRYEADQSRRGPLRLAGIRGAITDRANHVLASSVYVGDLGFDPYPFKHPTDAKLAKYNEAALVNGIEFLAPILNTTPDALAGQIADIRKNLDVEEEKEEQRIKKETDAYNIAKLTNPAAKKPDTKVHVKRFYSLNAGLSLDTSMVIKGRASTDFKENHKLGRYRLIGFNIADKTRRELTSPLPFCQLIGLVDKQNNGQSGLELGCNIPLTPTESRGEAELDKKRKPFPETITWQTVGHDGYTVHTALDPYIQQIAFQQAQIIMDKFHPKGVSIIVEDPNSGDMLAMVSAPVFDPSPEARKTLKLVPSTKENVTGDERMVERCASFLYEPGSTMKGITVASALEQGDITMYSRFPCAGKINIGGKTIHCPVYGPWDAHGHGSVDARSLLEHSCNVAAAQIGVRMGPERLYGGLRKFGIIGESLYLDIPTTKIGSPLKDKHERESNGAIARAAFGHSMVTTSAHIVRAYSAFANGGLLIKQRLVTSITDDKGKVLIENKPTILRPVLSP